jgi:hypothetical protein
LSAMSQIHLVNRRTRRLVAFLGLLALSTTAVGVREAGYPEGVPWMLAQALDRFAEPGVAVWWLTMGGVFQAFPSTVAGYFLVILANTMLWLVVAATLVSVARMVRRSFLRLPR